MTSRRRPMTRIGELMPAAARALGLEDELRLSRAIATFEAIVAERVGHRAREVRAAHAVDHHGGLSVEAVRVAVVDHVEADAPIVAQELRLMAPELLAAFAAAPGGMGVRDLRVRVRRDTPRL